MPTDSPSQGPRRHFHRGRRGHDRRGGDRRTPQQQPPRQDQAARSDRVDVEQIMREIRSNIAQRHGVELTDQQIQELAARRLESILDPRTVKPSLLDQLRRAAGARPAQAPAAAAEPPYTFEDTTLFESPNAFVRFMRKLLAPILKLFFNPNPLIRALNIQARLNTEALKREAERDERQAEWNALHYDLLQRVVSETAKVSLEIQNLALRVESLAGKVDFNERRVRGIEGSMHQARPSGPRERDRDRERDREPSPPQEQQRQPQQPAMPQPALEPVAQAEAGTPETVQQGEAPRRRRRRRRGRRGGGGQEAATPGAVESAAAIGAAEIDESEEEIEAEGAPATGADLEGQTSGSAGTEVPAYEEGSAGTEVPANEEGSAGTEVPANEEPSWLAEARSAKAAGPSFSSDAEPVEAVTTEGEMIAETAVSEAQPAVASLPEAEPAREPERLLPDEPEPVRVLDPAATPDDSKPERGPTGQ